MSEGAAVADRRDVPVNNRNHRWTHYVSAEIDSLLATGH